MFVLLQVLSVLFVAVAMTTSLAHVYELPQMLRLDKPHYVAAQALFSPGLTVGGLISEWGALASTLLLVVMTPMAAQAFPYGLGALAALAVMHIAYWWVAKPLDRFWQREATMPPVLTRLPAPASGFFETHPLYGPMLSISDDSWKRVRKIWEYSHVGRAVLACAGLLALILSIVAER